MYPRTAKGSVNYSPPSDTDRATPSYKDGVVPQKPSKRHRFVPKFCLKLDPLVQHGYPTDVSFEKDSHNEP